MCMQQTMFALKYDSPDEELLMACMNNMILVSRPAGTFRSVAALQIPF